MELFHKALQSMLKNSYQEILNELGNRLDCGAIPSLEYQYGLIWKFTDKYKVNFASLRDMTAWAIKMIEDILVVTSDGSQIYPSNEYNIPVSVIQVAWYRNYHSLTKPYQKNTKVDLLTPEDFMLKIPNLSTMIERSEYSQEPVNVRRFEMELDVLIEEMKNSYSNNEKNFSIIDGSLILSFILQTHDSLRDRYWQAIYKGLQLSATTKIPLIGYNDSSEAKEIVNMIKILKIPSNIQIEYITDADLIESYFQKELNYELQFGDRTCSFICRRNEPIYQQYYLKSKPSDAYQIAFFYIKLNNGQFARIEFPHWCLQQEGLVDKIALVIIAEAILGAGYPYMVDQCHHLTVLTWADKQKFFDLFQNLTQNEWKLPFVIKNKAKSKIRRT